MVRTNCPLITMTAAEREQFISDLAMATPSTSLARSLEVARGSMALLVRLGIVKVER